MREPKVTLPCARRSRQREREPRLCFGAVAPTGAAAAGHLRLGLDERDVEVRWRAEQREGAPEPDDPPSDDDDVGAGDGEGF